MNAINRILLWTLFCFCLFQGGIGCQKKVPAIAVDIPPQHAETKQLPVLFEDVTNQSGIDFVHDEGPTGKYFLPQSIGSGCAFLDYDGDGLLDIYLLQNAGPESKSINRLYRQTKPGHFEDVTTNSGLGVSGYHMGVAIGDINNDGKPDILLTQFGGVRLFVNQGNGTFEDWTKQLGLVNPVLGTSAAFFDFDRDGWLDILIVNYVDYDPKIDCISTNGGQDFCGPKGAPFLPSKLFRNQGPKQGGTPQKVQSVSFVDVSADSGIGSLPGPGLGVICADFNGDGWPDVFVANDGEANRLWINQKNGTFREEAISRGVALTGMGKAYAGMGVAAGDTNNKGLLDLFVTHLGSETNTLWRQEKPGKFRDRTQEANLFGTTWHGTGFGVILADFTNKGSLDIAVANGRVYKGGPARGTNMGFWETYADHNQLFLNNGSGRFQDISSSNPGFCDYWTVARGLACGDFDNDGALDLLITAIGEKPKLFRNIAPNRGHWLKLRVIDPQLKREAYGAEVRLRIKDQEQLRLLNPAESFLSSSSSFLHFGLGEALEYDSIRVKWPDGLEEVFPGGPSDRLVELHRKSGLKP